MDKTRVKDLTGERFGMLIVIKRVKNGWECLCDCGKTHFVQTGALNAGSTKSCGCGKFKNRPSRKENLIGQTFGRWKVIGEIGRYKNTNFIIWECVCECGTIKQVLSNALRSGNSKSCGCLQKEMVGAMRFKDLTGKRYGKLFVLKRIRKQPLSRVFWLCVCDCGIEIVLRGEIANGKVTSCGCDRIKKYRQPENLIGKKYGFLKVLEISKDRRNGKRPLWICLCKCGNKTLVPSSNLKNGHTTSCGCINDSFVSLELKDYFINNYNAIPEYRIFKNPKSGKWLPYDIYLPKENIFIEINGSQHYVYRKGSFTGTKEELDYRKLLDKRKKRYAKTHGVYIEIDLRKIKTTEKAIKYISKFL